MRYDVAVVGAGPAGSVAAREMASAGLRVLLLEEHRQVGRPVHCAGLVTPRTLEAAGVSQEVVVNRIRGAVVHTPAGGQVVLGGDRTYALAIDRELLDRRLSEQAQEAGATLALGQRVTGLERSGGRVRLQVVGEGSRRVVEARLVVGADGARSAVAAAVGEAAPREFVVATGGEVAVRPLSQEMVEVFVHPELARGWFGWLIPVGGGVARIGIGSSEGGVSPRRLLDGLMERHAHLRGGRYLRLQGGVIPLAPLRRVATDGVMLAGDAAGQVKPTSGGGIYTSILAGRLCGQVAVEALGRGDASQGALSRYGVLWSERVGRELLLGSALRRLLLDLTPREVEAFLRLFDVGEVREMALAHGDIDFPSHLFSRLFRPGPVWMGLRALPLRLWPRMAWLLAGWWLGAGWRGPSFAPWRGRRYNGG